MPVFSRSSLRKLKQCHVDLQKVFNEVVKSFDCTIVCGHRGRQEQNLAFTMGKSKLSFPQSKHNKSPSLAVDVAPWIKGKGIVWTHQQCYYFGGYVMGIAEELMISLRYGGDWSMDNDVSDQTFLDLVHFELI